MGSQTIVPARWIENNAEVKWMPTIEPTGSHRDRSVWTFTPLERRTIACIILWTVSAPFPDPKAGHPTRLNTEDQG